MLHGIIDNLKLICSCVYKKKFLLISNGEGKTSVDTTPNSESIKNFKKHVEEGVILRYSMHVQKSTLPEYKVFDDYINEKRRKEVDRLNEKYYGKEKYIKIKQCME